MHELGICDAMLKMLRGIVKEQELEGINGITVEVGMLSGVVPRFMSECWEAVIDGTEFADTTITVETVDGVAKCLDCGTEFTADLDNLRCPDCGGNKLIPISGRELTLKEIQAY